MLKRILSDSVVYGLTRYASVIAAIFLTPIYTRILLKEEYGVMDLFNTLNMVVLQVLPLGLITAVLRFYPDFKDNAEERRRTIGTIFLFLLAQSGIYVLAMWLLESPLLRLVLDSSEYAEVYRWSLFIVFGTILMTLCQTVLRAKLEKGKYLIVSMSNFLLLTGLGFYLVYELKMGVVGFFRASGIGVTVATLLSLVFIRSELSMTFSLSRLRELLKYSVHLVTVFFLFQATNLLDRYIIVELGNLDEVGIYSIGSRVANITQLAIAGFSLAWFPLAMDIKDSPDAARIYGKVANVYALLAALIVGGIAIFRKELLLIFAPDYFEAFNLIAILTLTNIVNGGVYVYTLGIHVSKRTKFLSWAALCSIIFNIIISIALYRVIGLDGIAYGSLAGAFVWIAIQVGYSQRYFKVPFSWAMPALGLLIAGVLLVVGVLIDQLEWQLVVSVACKLFLLAISLALVPKILGVKLMEIITKLKSGQW